MRGRGRVSSWRELSAGRYDELLVTHLSITTNSLTPFLSQPPTQLVDYVGFCRGADAPPAPKAPEGARTMDEAAYETVDTSSGDFSTISPKQVMQKMLDGWNPYVIDVRIKPEEKIARLPFTDALIPHRDVMPEDLPLNRDILFFCKGGVRSNKVCKRAAKEFGLPNAIYEIEGGIMGWKREIDASIPKY